MIKKSLYTILFICLFVGFSFSQPAISLEGSWIGGYVLVDILFLPLKAIGYVAELFSPKEIPSSKTKNPEKKHTKSFHEDLSDNKVRFFDPHLTMEAKNKSYELTE